MTDLNDSLDNLFAGDTSSTPRPMAAHTPKDFAPKAEQAFVEGCAACRGTGRFVSYSGRTVGQCFKCKGAGKRTFRTSSEDRAKSREQVAARKVRVAEEGLADFAKAHKAEHKWIIETAPRFEFARNMLEAVLKYGDLTENQMAAVRKCLARDEARTAERTQATQNAPSVDAGGVDRLKAAFDKAVAYNAEKGLKLSPKITVDGITLSPAKASGKNPGAIYAKVRGGEYLGKVQNGRFFAARECTAEQAAKVQAFIADPLEAAKVYGQTTGTCCLCGATLKSEWKHLGVGPICSEKFGF